MEKKLTPERSPQTLEELKKEVLRKAIRNAAIARARKALEKKGIKGHKAKYESELDDGRSETEERTARVIETEGESVAEVDREQGEETLREKNRGALAEKGTAENTEDLTDEQWLAQAPREEGDRVKE